MSTRPRSHLLPLLLLAGLSLGHGGTNESGGGGGCGGSDEHARDEDSGGLHASGAECPPGGGPTAANFGQAFLETYCLSCHSVSVRGEERAGAPEGMDFDTPGQVRQWAEAIDAHCAAGPSAVNTQMPPRPHPEPTLEEREKLGQWLACGAP